MTPLTYKFIRVGLDVEQERWAGKPIYFVFNIKSGEAIGRILWYATWRRFIFQSALETVWSSDCLANIIDALDKITAYHALQK